MKKILVYIVLAMFIATTATALEIHKKKPYRGKTLYVSKIVFPSVFGNAGSISIGDDMGWINQMVFKGNEGYIFDANGQFKVKTMGQLRLWITSHKTFVYNDLEVDGNIVADTIVANSLEVNCLKVNEEEFGSC